MTDSYTQSRQLMADIWIYAWTAANMVQWRSHKQLHRTQSRLGTGLVFEKRCPLTLLLNNDWNYLWHDKNSSWCFTLTIQWANFQHLIIPVKYVPINYRFRQFFAVCCKKVRYIVDVNIVNTTFRSCYFIRRYNRYIVTMCSQPISNCLIPVAVSPK